MVLVFIDPHRFSLKKQWFSLMFKDFDGTGYRFSLMFIHVHGTWRWVSMDFHQFMRYRVSRVSRVSQRQEGLPVALCNARGVSGAKPMAQLSNPSMRKLVRGACGTPHARTTTANVYRNAVGHFPNRSRNFTDTTARS